MRHFPESVESSKLDNTLENGEVMEERRDILLAFDEWMNVSMYVSVSMCVIKIPF